MFEWLKSKFKKNDVTENLEENVEGDQLTDAEAAKKTDDESINDDNSNVIEQAQSVENVIDNLVENATAETEPVHAEKFASDSNLADAHRMLNAFNANNMMTQADDSQEIVSDSIETAVEETVEETVAENTVEIKEEIKEEITEVSITDSITEESIDQEVSEQSVVETVEEVVVETTEVLDVAENSENTNESSEESENTELSEEVEEPVKKKGFFSRLFAGLSKTRDNIVAGMDELFSSDDKIDDDFYEELEEILILGDIGVHTTENILEKLKSQVKSEHIKKRTQCKDLLIANIKEEMAVEETAYKFETEQSIVFVIGVNGVGKTTSIGKLASHLKNQGKRVMLVAADTFRAAAGSQLEEWSHRAGVEMIGGKAGQDPASVLFDGVEAAKARNVDVLLVDTAGRLHNKKNLMEELKKMNRIIDKSFPDAHRENLIVLDASTGQNALNQAKEFGEVADLTGIILTKMDGTAKGGIAIAISSELNIPVKYIGVGEKISDLQKFDSDLFVDALFAVNLDEDEIAGEDEEQDTEE